MQHQSNVLVSQDTQLIRLPLIDLLRFLAAFSVMVMHILQRGFPGDQYYHFSFGGIGEYLKWNYLAVNLFFMISGFVIFYTAQNRSVRQFFVSRFLRLYPAYWICCTLSFVVSFIFLKEILNPTLARYVINMTMLNGFFNIGYIDGVYWTLFVELKFYILTLIIIYFNQLVNAEKILWGWLIISGLNYVCRVPLIENLLITNYASFFCAGAMLYLITKDNFKFTIPRAIFLLLSFLIGFLNEQHTLISKSIHYAQPYSSISLFLILITLYVIFYGAIRLQNIPKSLIKPFSLLGKSSYPLYLIHLNLSIAALNFIASDGTSRYLVATFLIILMPLLAYLIAVKFEEPLRSIIKKSCLPD